MGHENIRATHKTTLEITKEGYLTPRGDCIVATAADKGFPDISDEFKERLREGKKIRIEIECSGIKDRIKARGHPQLTFKDSEEMVVRKSDFICSRTLAIKADKSAFELDRGLVNALREGKKIDINFILY